MLMLVKQCKEGQAITYVKEMLMLVNQCKEG